MIKEKKIAYFSKTKMNIYPNIWSKRWIQLELETLFLFLTR
jgi:hypothetical protein